MPLTEVTAFNWHAYLPGRPARASATRYRVHGPWAPERGHRFNPFKLLIDPYAKAIEGAGPVGRGNVLPYEPDGEDADLRARRERRRRRDPQGRSSSTARFDWEGDRPPMTPWNETLIYEVHVKGFTKRHPGVREDLRGTYAGLASDEAIAHLRSLGVTAVELLPVHHIADEHHLVDKGLTNYWGYSSIGFLAPHAEYAATGRMGEQVREFKGMVKALHRGGHRGDPRRGLQPHRRGQPPGPDALVQGHRQPARTTAARPRTRATTWTSRAPATASTRSTPACCA